jgi:thiol-disulfide isomerase/thioredoxin
MLKKALLTLGTVALVVAGVVTFLYTTNRPPQVRALSETEIADSGRPVLVKLHAQWCPVCMATKGVWSQLEEAYRDRVNFVVLDFTDERTTALAAVEARRINLEGVFNEYAGATGLVLVVDGRTRAVKAEVGGVRGFTAYQADIDAALAP